MTDQLSNRLDGAIDAVVARQDATAALRDPELAPLVRIAADLRHYPGVNFKARLRAQLERRQTMSTAVLSGVRGGRSEDRRLRRHEGFTTVTPYVWVPDRGFSDFLVRVFDAVETRVTDGGRHGTHREMRVGDSMLMLGEGAPGEIVPGRSMAFHVFVDDVDAVYAKALAAGGESLGEPADRPYGERAGFIKDAYANHWYIASPLGPQSLAHSLKTVTPFLHSRDVRGFIDFLVRAFGASEEVVHELPGGNIPYARARVGDAAIELGTADPMRGALCLYVADPDLVYEQAVAAGAKPLSPPADQPSGERMAFVEDALGNQWYITRPAR
jgi:PhnB protein